jgi:hypothetical protein
MALHIIRHPEPHFSGGRAFTSQALVESLCDKILTQKMERCHGNILLTPVNWEEEEIRYFAYSRIQV